MSFALLVPQRTDAHMLQPELDAIVNTPNSPTAGLVKLIVIDRVNGILAISPQPQYLKDLKKWMEVLDRAGGDNEKKLFVYHVQNGRAADLATVLINAFGGGGSASSSTAHPTAPNLGATGQASQIGSTTSGFGSTGGQTGFGGTGGTTGGMGGGGFQSGGFGSTGGSTGGFGQQSTDSNPSLAPGSTTTQPQNVSQTLQLPGGGQPITVSSDENNNAIVVWATPRQYGTIQDALRQLDSVPLQVVIEAAITEVSLTKELQFGVQWLLNSGVGSTGFSQGTTATPAPVFPGFNYVVSSGQPDPSDAQRIAVHHHGQDHLGAEGAGAEQPHGVAAGRRPGAGLDGQHRGLDDRRSRHHLGDSVCAHGGHLAGDAARERQRIGAARHLAGGQRRQARTAGNTSGAAAAQPTPTIEDRKFQSSIAVHDGQTIALGGLIRDNNSHDRDGIPYLSQIPYLGALFGSTDNIDNRTELLVLLTPRVIRNAADAKSITDELKEKIGTVTPPGPPRGVIH